eukprot:1158356-Pelagomonas_calceolata.AAC.10
MAKQSCSYRAWGYLGRPGQTWGKATFKAPGMAKQSYRHWAWPNNLKGTGHGKAPYSHWAWGYMDRPGQTWGRASL